MLLFLFPILVVLEKEDIASHAEEEDRVDQLVVVLVKHQSPVV